MCTRSPYVNFYNMFLPFFSDIQRNVQKDNIQYNTATKAK